MYCAGAESAFEWMREGGSRTRGAAPEMLRARCGWCLSQTGVGCASRQGVGTPAVGASCPGARSVTWVQSIAGTVSHGAVRCACPVSHPCHLHAAPRLVIEDVTDLREAGGEEVRLGLSAPQAVPLLGCRECAVRVEEHRQGTGPAAEGDVVAGTVPDHEHLRGGDALGVGRWAGSSGLMDVSWGGERDRDVNHAAECNKGVFETIHCAPMRRNRPAGRPGGASRGAQSHGRWRGRRGCGRDREIRESGRSRPIAPMARCCLVVNVTTPIVLTGVGSGVGGSSRGSLAHSG